MQQNAVSLQESLYSNSCSFWGKICRQEKHVYVLDFWSTFDITVLDNGSWASWAFQTVDCFKRPELFQRSCESVSTRGTCLPFKYQNAFGPCKSQTCKRCDSQNVYQEASKKQSLFAHGITQVVLQQQAFGLSGRFLWFNHRKVSLTCWVCR